MGMGKVFGTALVTGCVLVGCAASPRTTPPGPGTRPSAPAGLYIPQEAKSSEPSALAVVEWGGPAKLRGPGELEKIDATEVKLSSHSRAFLTPGKHVFEYAKYRTHRSKSRKGTESLTILGLDRFPYVVSAGRTYRWGEMLREIDPDALRVPDEVQQPGVLFQYKMEPSGKR